MSTPVPHHPLRPPRPHRSSRPTCPTCQPRPTCPPRPHRRPRPLQWLLPLALLAAIVAACGRPDTSLTDVTGRGYLVVGTDASFPPFETVAGDGSLQGLDVDMARLLAVGMGLGVQFRNVSFDGLYDALAAGQVDAIVSALPYDALRTEDVRFSPAYFDDGLVLIGRGGVAPPTADGLVGTVAAEMGSEAAALVRQRYPDVKSEDLFAAITTRALAP